MLQEKLVKKAQKGDDKAFLKLIEPEKEKLYRMAFMYVKDESDALDVVQETIYKAYVAIDKIKEASYFSTWLTRILINTSLDYLKMKNKVIPIEQDAVERIESAEKLETEDRLDLQHAIEQLDDKYKTVIMLRYFQDLTVKQIAELLEYPEGTVKTNLHRAVNKLRGNLKGACVNE